MSLQYFDVNVGVGKHGLKNRHELWSTEDVLRVMDECGVAAALVYSGWAKDYSPRYGNERLMEELSKSERLYGCYTILPDDLGDFLSPEDAMADLRAKGMAAAKIFPKTHWFLPNETSLGPYLSLLEEEGIPLLVDYSEIGLPYLEGILKAHPALNVVLLGASWSCERIVFSLMRDYPNLYLDFSNLQGNFVLEAFVQRLGADRLLFGSGMPQMSLGAARALVDYSYLSDEDKRKIAGGNLARLCKIQLPPAPEVKNDEIACAASEGKPIPVFVFDSHTHYLEDGGSTGGGYPMLHGDLEHMSKLNERMGVDRYCVAPWLGIWTDSEAGNAVAQAMAERDSRVAPFVLIDPNYVEDLTAQAKACHLKHHMPGFKMFYARTHVRYNDPVYAPWWELANANSLYALMDSGDYPGYLDDMELLAQRYPNVSIFLDHAGRNFPTAQEYAEYAKSYDNIYLQLTYTSVPQGLVEYLVSEGLAHKTLYGTDAPMRDPRPQLGWVAYANIPLEAKKLILGGNMQRIYDRCFRRAAVPVYA